MAQESLSSHDKHHASNGGSNRKNVVRRFFIRVSAFVQKHKIISSIILVVLVAGLTVGIWVLTQDKAAPKVSGAVAAEYQKRLPELKKAVEDKPNDAAARKNYAVALYATGNFNDSRKQYEEAVKINDRDSVAYNNLGNVYRDLKSYDKAIDSYKKSIEIDSKTINTYVNLANVQLYNKDDSGAAIQVYKDGLRALPDNEQLLLLLGIAYEQANQVSQAKQTYQTILNKNADNAAAKANLDRLNKK